MAQRLRLPAVRDARPLADGRRAVLVRAMTAPDIGDGWNHLPPHPDPTRGLVRGRVAHDCRKEWRFGQDSAPDPRSRFLSNRVGRGVMGTGSNLVPCNHTAVGFAHGETPADRACRRALPRHLAGRQAGGPFYPLA